MVQISYYPIFLIFLLQLIFFEGAYAQASENMVPEEVLTNPIENASWFDENIPLIEVPNYDTTVTNFVLRIENGYAEYRFKPLLDNYLNDNFISISVDIVFTKYPLKREDWITNYYELLANRLKAIFAMDKTLNSNHVSWRLVMQTACKNESEAKSLFHGVVITYQQEVPSEFSRIDIPETMYVQPEPTSLVPSSEIIPNNEVPEEIDDPTLKSILYPESINKNGKVEPYIPPRYKNSNEPDCPKFAPRKRRKSLFWRK
jgi:hypothetical protein